ncbi:MAG: beta-N-acetylhexosaminidase [Candidatus Desulfofervidus auxilii]|nr:beta-N-acetylhexosaminidase [Candidatus Desulfofervidus auxilii]
MFAFIPPVKKFYWLDNSEFRFDSQTLIFLDSNDYEFELNLFWKNIKEIIGKSFKICGQYRYKILNKDHLSYRPSIYFLKATNPLAKKLLDAWEIKIKNDEGYAIIITKDFFLVSFNSKKGLFYAIQTIKQIILMSHIRIVRGKKYLSIPTLVISDYPIFPFRAVHMTVFDTFNIKRLKEVIKIASELKFNVLILHIDNNLKYSSHPEISSPNALSKNQLRDIINFAKKRYFIVIPELNLLCKQERLLAPAYPRLIQHKLLQKSKRFLCYDPKKKEVYKIVFDLIEELLNLFHPEYFHIGHDECFGMHKYNPPISYRLFAKDINIITDFLFKKGVRTIIWSDMLKKEKNGGYKQMYKAIDFINKNVIIADWIYFPQKTYSSIIYFRKKGFEVIGATFKDERAIATFSSFMKKLVPKPLGMIATTWYYFPWGKQEMLIELLETSSINFW